MNVTGKVFTRIKKHYPQLTVTDRRIATVLTEDAEMVAFSTVAQVAEQAQTSGPSILRFAEKLGYSGFVGLQKAVRDDLSQYLSSSLKRINQTSTDNSIAHTQAIEIHNVEATLSKVDEKVLDRLIGFLADDSRSVYLLASEQCYGPAITFHDLLSVIRPRVRLLKGSPYRISNQLMEAKAKDLLITMDFERYENWLVKTHQLAVSKKLYAVAITNNPLSTIATLSQLNFFASATAPGPFDSNTGLNALLNLFIGHLAQREQSRLSKRLNYVHGQWQQDGVFE